MNHPQSDDTEQSKLFSYLQTGQTALKQCPLCKKEYSLDSVDVLVEEDPVHLVHTTCPHCEASVLAIVTLSDYGMSSIGLYTDLTASDVRHLYGKSPVSEDDVLNFYTYLETHGQHFVRAVQNAQHDTNMI